MCKAHNHMDKSKIIQIAAIGGAILLGLSIFFFSKYKTTEGEMKEMKEVMEYEKEQLEEEYSDMALEMEGFSHKIDNDSILNMIDKEQQRVKLLLEELKTVKVTNARRIQELKAELASVRKVLVYYVAQVDSLNTVNERLTVENREVHARYNQITELADSLEEQTVNLEKKVTIASQLDASNITFQSKRKRGSNTKYVKYTAYFQLDFSILKNITSSVGKKTIYVRITAPDNTILQKSPNDTFLFEDSQIAFSAKKEFEYGGEETTQTLYYTITETLWEGKYRADIFIDGHLVGSSSLTLK